MYHIVSCLSLSYHAPPFSLSNHTLLSITSHHITLYCIKLYRTHVRMTGTQCIVVELESGEPLVELKRTAYSAPHENKTAAPASPVEVKIFDAIQCNAMQCMHSIVCCIRRADCNVCSLYSCVQLYIMSGHLTSNSSPSLLIDVNTETLHSLSLFFT